MYYGKKDRLSVWVCPSFRSLRHPLKSLPFEQSAAEERGSERCSGEVDSVGSGPPLQERGEMLRASLLAEDLTVTSLQQVLPAIEKPSIRQGVVYVDQVRAVRWLEECRYERNRKLDQSFVDGLIDALKNAQWQVREIQFAVLPDGREQLIDGQHGLNAIKQCGIPAWCRVSWQDFPDQHAVDEAYARIDAGRPRGMRDALTALGVGTGQLEHLSDVGRLAAAVTLIQTRFLGFGGIPMQERGAMRLRNRDEKAKLCNEWMSEMREFVFLTDQPLRRLSGLFRLSGVTAVGLVTLRYDKDRAKEFWNAVAQTVLVAHNSPILRLRELTKSDKSSRGGPYVSRYTANAWNAWRKGNEVTARGFGNLNARGNIDIDGTPYTDMRNPDLKDLPSPEQWEKDPKRNALLARWNEKKRSGADETSIPAETVGSDPVGAGAGVREDHAA